VASKVLSDNHSEENQRQHTDGPKVLVYVLNKNGKPLMPCKPTKARHLLEQNRAKAVSRKPFTIQLLWTCEHKTQPVKLGMDPWIPESRSLSSIKQKELLSAEIQLRTDMPKKLQEKAMYRRNRRIYYGIDSQDLKIEVNLKNG